MNLPGGRCLNCDVSIFAGSSLKGTCRGRLFEDECPLSGNSSPALSYNLYKKSKTMARLLLCGVGAWGTCRPSNGHTSRPCWAANRKVPNLCFPMPRARMNPLLHIGCSNSSKDLDPLTAEPWRRRSSKTSKDGWPLYRGFIYYRQKWINFGLLRLRSWHTCLVPPSPIEKGFSESWLTYQIEHHQIEMAWSNHKDTRNLLAPGVSKT